MDYLLKHFEGNNVMAEIAVMNKEGKAKELQVMLHVLPVDNFDVQVGTLCETIKEILCDSLFADTLPVFCRCFLSDAANQFQQAKFVISDLLQCTVGYIQQPPLDGSKIALWIQMQTGVICQNSGSHALEHNGYTHYFSSFTDLEIPESVSYQQARWLLEKYEKQLEDLECSIDRHCMRTWFFMRDIDANYKGFVEARKENFIANGLTKDTHYIASTGIQGCAANHAVKVLMDAYAIKGLEEGQVTYLYAKDCLNPTYDYGVTFERGVQLDYGDRRKVLISGTASIDNEGVVLYEGDIKKQVIRMWNNVEALLNEAECTSGDMIQIIVYLRDVADYHCVKKMFDEKFCGVPALIVLAPICRQGWLVEMECMASKYLYNSKFRDL